MRTGIVYSYRLLTVNYRAGKRLRPIALVGIGTYFTFVAARVQPADEDDDPTLARVLGSFYVELRERLDAYGTKGLAAWIDGRHFDHYRSLHAVLEPEERAFTLTPGHNVLAEAQRVYRQLVLGRLEEKLLEPPGVWARELPVFSLYPARLTEAASSR